MKFNTDSLLSGIAGEVIAQEAAPFTTVHAGWDELNELIHAWPENEDVDTSVTLAYEIAATAIRYILDSERIKEAATDAEKA